ncbi:MAG: hypothetical protein KF774_11765 [Planctomyces sp.]|nr:hypothetical protein [Planctomyces sp.]
MAEHPSDPAAGPSDGVPDAELTAYLDELLSADRAAAIEVRLRESPGLRQRVAGLIRRRDQGGHSVGEIWRRRRLSCPSRADLGAYVLGVLEPAHAEYIRFHIHTVGCRICEANLVDLEQSCRKGEQDPEPRRRRFFESSAGRLADRR